MKRASVMYICSSSFTSFLRAVDDLVDRAFGEVREQAEELPLDRLGARPFVEVDEGALVGRSRRRGDR